MPSDVETLKALTSALHDSLMVLAPPGWTQVDLQIISSPEGLRVQELSAKGNGAAEPPLRPRLNIELGEEATRLGEGLSELAQLLARQGKSWSGGRVKVFRTKDFTDWTLLLPDGKVRWFARLSQEELDTLVFTDDLFQLLRGTERAFHFLQDAFEQRLGPISGHAYSEEDQRLVLTGSNGVVRASAQLVGSYARESFLWVWGWAVDSLAPACYQKVRRVCAPETAQPGLSALWRDHFHCDEGFAWALAAHVAVAVGARGLVRAETPGMPVIVLYAVMENPS